MGRGNGNLLFNLALILIFCHLSKQPPCFCCRGDLGGRNWPRFLKAEKAAHWARSWEPCLGGTTAGSEHVGWGLPVKTLLPQKEAHPQRPLSGPGGFPAADFHSLTAGSES